MLTQNTNSKIKNNMVSYSLTPAARPKLDVVVFYFKNDDDVRDNDNGWGTELPKGRNNCLALI